MQYWWAEMTFLKIDSLTPISKRYQYHTVNATCLVYFPTFTENPFSSSRHAPLRWDVGLVLLIDSLCLLNFGVASFFIKPETVLWGEAYNESTGKINKWKHIYIRIYVHSVSFSISKNADMIHITAINSKMIQSAWKGEWHSLALSLHSIWALREFWEIWGHYYCTLDWKRNATWMFETERERRGIKLTMNTQVTETDMRWSSCVTWHQADIQNKCKWNTDVTRFMSLTATTYDVVTCDCCRSWLLRILQTHYLMILMIIWCESSQSAFSINMKLRFTKFRPDLTVKACSTETCMLCMEKNTDKWVQHDHIQQYRVCCDTNLHKTYMKTSWHRATILTSLIC